VSVNSRGTGSFGEPEEWPSSWQRPYTRDEWLDLVPTTGGFGRMPGPFSRRSSVFGAAGGSFAMGYTTLAITAARLAP
jgi:hypothetical protein